MKQLLFLLSLVILLVGPVVPPARGQSFSPPEPPAAVLVRAGRERFTLALFYTRWENPFRVRVTTFSPALLSLGLNPVVTRDFRLTASTPASPLFEGTYTLGRRWTLGFWYNPIRGERLRKTVMPADLPVNVDLSRDVDLADIHLAYDGPRGLSGQVGYYHEHGTIRGRTDFNSPTPNLGHNYTLVSWNFWVTQQLDASIRGRSITPFVSAGYHPASSLNHAVSILTGAAVTFGTHVSLTGSVWLFDLSNTATRVTGGVVIWF